jgi:hypothetical protein
VQEHPPCAPVLAPSEFFVFLKIKEIMKGRHFDDIDDIRSNMTAALDWSNEHELCFVDHYKQNVILWDPWYVDYKKKVN